MKRSAFLFFKGLGLLFAILVGIGTAVLGWFDAADWINIVFYSMATSALVLWGWHHFSIRWIHSDLKQDFFSQVSKKEKIEKEDINKLTIILANEATSIIHGKEDSLNAEKTAKKTFQEKSTGEGLLSINIEKNKIFFQQMQETITKYSSSLIFFSLELNNIENKKLKKILKKILI